MIRTMPLGHLHRDAMNRVIRQNDIVAWTNRKQGQGLTFCEVQSSTVETIRIAKPDGRLTNVDPSNVLVITQQVERNAIGNVGANMEFEEAR